VAIRGQTHVEGVEVVLNELVADESGRVRAVPTEERETIPCGVVFRSVGYLGVPLAGLPFEERRGTVPNDGGRVLDAGGAPLPGVYVAGWIKRGPTGVIGTNKKDATETIALLLEDARAGRLPEPERPDADAPVELLAERGVEFVSYAGWQAIDAVERAAGEPHGRPRIKLCTWDELLAAGLN
jgi:ferredoxin--NADP+ reductase